MCIATVVTAAARKSLRTILKWAESQESLLQRVFPLLMPFEMAHNLVLLQTHLCTYTNKHLYNEESHILRSVNGNEISVGNSSFRNGAYTRLKSARHTN
jgi:hypothetical protein